MGKYFIQNGLAVMPGAEEDLLLALIVVNFDGYYAKSQEKTLWTPVEDTDAARVLDGDMDGLHGVFWTHSTAAWSLPGPVSG